MYICRAQETRTIALDRSALNTFLREQGFEEAYLRDLGIFLVPAPLSSEEEEEGYLTHSPVSNNIFVAVEGVTEEEIERRTGELIRECALEGSNSPWAELSFAGIETIEDWEQDIKQFGEKAASFRFVSFSSQQPKEEWDDFFVKREPQREEISQQQESAFTYLMIAIVATSLFFQRLLHR